MKHRRFLLLLLAALLVLSLAISVSAETQPELDHVTDAAGLLTYDQNAALEARAEEISDTYQFGLYLIVVNDFTDYAHTGDVFEATVYLYEKYHLGMGEEKAGSTLLLSMSERDYCLHFNGESADYAFTEAGRDGMEDRILPYFRQNDFYGGFNEYLNCCEEYLQAAKDGKPVGEGMPGRNQQKAQGGFSILFFVPGIFAMAVTGVILVSPMRSAGVKTEANQYAVPGSMRLTRQSDHFLRRTVSRRPREKQTSGGGGGSMSHSSGSHSSGSHSSGSHSGRSGKF